MNRLASILLFLPLLVSCTSLETDPEIAKITAADVNSALISAYGDFPKQPYNLPLDRNKVITFFGPINITNKSRMVNAPDSFTHSLWNVGGVTNIVHDRVKFFLPMSGTIKKRISDFITEGKIVDDLQLQEGARVVIDYGLYDGPNF